MLNRPVHVQIRGLRTRVMQREGDSDAGEGDVVPGTRVLTLITYIRVTERSNTTCQLDSISPDRPDR